MKTPKKVAQVNMPAVLQKRLREEASMKRLMASVEEDQVWKHTSGTEYTVILIANKDATKSSYPVTVNYYGPDGKYWAQSLERFVQDKVLLRKRVSSVTPAEQELGSWMSAALTDGASCPELKAAAQAWLNELPFPKEGKQ